VCVCVWSYVFLFVFFVFLCRFFVFFRVFSSDFFDRVRLKCGFFNKRTLNPKPAPKGAKNRKTLVALLCRIALPGVPEQHPCLLLTSACTCTSFRRVDWLLGALGKVVVGSECACSDRCLVVSSI
jgi:hypothetical protein